ncbi:MAG TPA: ABC transporter permease, partial [Gemmatimonadota bacterium]|nr:ABC transporter permease [Gemmatimonadota bacterium]
LMAQAFLEMQRVNPGFDADRLLTVGVRLSSAKYPDQEQRAAFQAEVLQAVGSVPRVEAVGAVQHLPLDFSTGLIGFEVENWEPSSPDDELFANLNLVSAGYFEAMGISVLRGRPFGAVDRPDSPPVIAINQTMADRFWPGQDPIGRQVVLDEDEPEGGRVTIVAVVADVKHRWLTGDVWPQIYVPQSQHASRGFTIVTRTAGDPVGFSTSVRQAIWSIDPGLPIGSARSMNQVVAQSLGPFQLASGIFTFFGILALLLACMGIYGVVSYAVGRRLSEFGIRMALGAEAGQVIGLVMRQGALLAMIGMAIGLAMTATLGQLLSGATAIVPRPGLLVYAAVALPLAASVLLASYVPSRRAAAIDPASALRSS